MNEIYKLEECPRGKQELQKIVDNIKYRNKIKQLERHPYCLFVRGKLINPYKGYINEN